MIIGVIDKQYFKVMSEVAKEILEGWEVEQNKKGGVSLQEGGLMFVCGIFNRVCGVLG